MFTEGLDKSALRWVKEVCFSPCLHTLCAMFVMYVCMCVYVFCGLIVIVKFGPTLRF